MQSSAFGILDLLESKLNQYRDMLGPLYLPVYWLLGSIVFLLFISIIIAMPLVLFSNLRQILLLQILILFVYFILLQSVKLDVPERFVYSFCLSVILSSSGEIISSNEAYGRILDTLDKNDSISNIYPKYDLFFSAFIRGIGNIAWAFPLLFGFYTFYPKTSLDGEDAIRRSLLHSLQVAFIFQGVATLLILWQDDVIGRFLASTEESIPFIKKLILDYQKGHLIFSLLYILLGFIVVTTIYIYSRIGTNPNRILVFIIFGIMFIQICFVVAKYNTRKLNTYYPASRFTRVSAYKKKNDSEENIYFSSPFFEDIGSKSLKKWQVFFSCVDRQSGHFSYMVLQKDEINNNYTEVNIQNIKMNKKNLLFCQDK